MFSILSLVFRYFFILLIYLFMFGIIRMIYLDIKGVGKNNRRSAAYLKLINRKDDLPFKVEEHYSINSETYIGRGNKNHIIIKDPYISKKHAVIHKRDHGYYIQDLESSNGTFINEEEVLNPLRLENGDIIKMGQISFLFVNEEG